MASSSDGVLTFVCLASGPSIIQEDVDYVRGKARVICVNDTYRLAPWADYLYAADAKWWDYHIEQVRKTFQGELYTIPNEAVNKHGIQWIEQKDGAGGLGEDRLHVGIRGGGNSGHQAINLAYFFGAKQIILLGYDMQKLNGKSHFFGEHPDDSPLPMRMKSPYDRFAESIATIDPKEYGIGIVNCTRQTALTCFPCRRLRDCL